MTQSEIATKLASIYLKDFIPTIQAHNGGDTFTITILQLPKETLSEFVERHSRIVKRLSSAFIVVNSENCYQGNYSSEIEFTYGLE